MRHPGSLLCWLPALHAVLLPGLLAVLCCGWPASASPCCHGPFIASQCGSQSLPVPLRPCLRCHGCPCLSPCGHAFCFDGWQSVQHAVHSLPDLNWCHAEVCLDASSLLLLPQQLCGSRVSTLPGTHAAGAQQCRLRLRQCCDLGGFPCEGGSAAHCRRSTVLHSLEGALGVDLYLACLAKGASAC